MLASLLFAAAAATIETTVVTASRLSDDIDNLATSIAVVDEDAIQRVQPVHPSELLNRVPGIWISRGNGQEHLTAIRSPVLTGAGSCGSFYIAEDGIPVRGVGFCNVNQLFDLNMEQAGRVEVLRGPGTAVHGSNALHGVINAISAAPDLDDRYLTLEGGPHDYYRVSVSSSTEQARLNFNAAHDGGYKHDSGFDQQKLTLRQNTGRDAIVVQNVLSVSNLNQETAGYIQGKNSYRDSARKRENPNPEAYRDSVSARFYSRISAPLDNGMAWQLTPYLRYTDMRFLQHFLPGLPLEENGQTGGGVQSALTGSWSEVNWQTGLDLEYTRGWLQQTQVDTVGGFLGTVLPPGKHYDYTVDATVAALYAKADMPLTERLQLLGGLRVESVNYDYDNKMLAGNTRDDGTPCSNVNGCRYTRPADRDDHFSNWSAHLGLVFQATEHNTLFANVADGFRAPETAELYRLQNGQRVADIDSEQLTSVEFGWRHHRPGLRSQLVAYWMDKRDVIFQDNNRQNVSGAETRHEGVEMELQWQLHTQWAVHASASYSRQRYDNNATDGISPGTVIRGNDIDTAPRRQAEVELVWTPQSGTDIALEWVYLDRYYLDPENDHRYTGHDLLNLRLRQQLGDQLSVGMRVLNLTDEDYAERADYAFNNYRYFVGEPRSVYLDLRWTF
ncbi:MAG TPA: TonB-dependent receptor [Spongiibacteraceae bacterium]|nr:TonB-dependent receptor [Spongiibacteraceae bacterium]